MKKLGTPNGAGPGNENENVGFPADGTPPEPRRAPEGLLFALALDFRDDGCRPDRFLPPGFFFFFLAGFVPPGVLRVDGGCFFAEPEGDGGPEEEAFEDPVEVVVVGTETEPDPVDPWVPVDPVATVDPVDPVDPVVPVEPVPVPVELDPAAPDSHDSETPTTPTFTGSEIDDNGVPAGTFNVKKSLPPPTTVTTITHESAWATGSAAIAEPASKDPPVASATSSFRLLNTLAYLLQLAPAERAATAAAPSGRY